MTIQTMLYIYLAICVSMIVFNCGYAVVFREQSSARVKIKRSFVKEMENELERVEKGKPVTREHKKHLRRTVRKANGLLAVDELFAEYIQKDKALFAGYIKEVSYEILVLFWGRRYKSGAKQALLTYFTSKYHLLKNRPMDFVLNTMLERTIWNDVYCRENALEVIYSSGRCDYMLRALKYIDEMEGYHNGKMLTDGLLTFAGDKEELRALLWKHFESFSPEMRVNLVNFFRFGGFHMEEELLKLMNDAMEDDEIRFSCIRYFGKFYYEPAYRTLISFSEQTAGRRWEYAAIANTALAAYPCERTIQALKQSLSSPNWYIRLNAAKSLEALDFNYMDLIEVIDGNDRYAREIMQYCLDLRMAKQGEGVAV